MMNKLNNIFYILLIFVFLVSCKKNSRETIQDGDFKIEYLFEKDGCKMYRFKDGSRYIYWSNCKGKTEYSYYQSTGKSGYISNQETITSN